MEFQRRDGFASISMERSSFSQWNILILSICQGLPCLLFHFLSHGRHGHLQGIGLISYSHDYRLPILLLSRMRLVKGVHYPCRLVLNRNHFG